MINFFLLWLLQFVLILFAMCIDNISWITSSTEWNTNATVTRKGRTWVGPVSKYSLGILLFYILEYRIMSVITDKRDLIPAILTSFVGALVLGVFI